MRNNVSLFHEHWNAFDCNIICCLFVWCQEINGHKGCRNEHVSPISHFFFFLNWKWKWENCSSGNIFELICSVSLSKWILKFGIYCIQESVRMLYSSNRAIHVCRVIHGILSNSRIAMESFVHFESALSSITFHFAEIYPHMRQFYRAVAIAAMHCQTANQPTKRTRRRAYSSCNELSLS